MGLTSEFWTTHLHHVQPERVVGLQNNLQGGAALGGELVDGDRAGGGAGGRWLVGQAAGSVAATAHLVHLLCKIVDLRGGGRSGNAGKRQCLSHETQRKRTRCPAAKAAKTQGNGSVRAAKGSANARHRQCLSRKRQRKHKTPALSQPRKAAET